MKKAFIIIPVFVLTACTINMSLTDTHGTASEVGDNAPQTSSQVNPNISVPVKPI